MGTFRDDLEHLLNRFCMENESNTPDFILANYLQNCLNAFTLATKNRDKWYSVHLEPANSHFIEDAPAEQENAAASTNSGITGEPQICPLAKLSCLHFIDGNCNKKLNCVYFESGKLRNA